MRACASCVYVIELYTELVDVMCIHYIFCTINMSTLLIIILMTLLSCSFLWESLLKKVHIIANCETLNHGINAVAAMRIRLILVVSVCR